MKRYISNKDGRKEKNEGKVTKLAAKLTEENEGISNKAGS
jgi:hypothetical protein